MRDPAELAGLNVVVDLFEMLAAALLRADLRDAFELRRRVYHRKRFIAAMIEGTTLNDETQRRSLPRLRLRAGLSNVRMAALEEKLHNSRIDVGARQFLIVELIAAVAVSLGLLAVAGPIGALRGAGRRKRRRTP